MRETEDKKWGSGKLKTRVGGQKLVEQLGLKTISPIFF